VADNFTLSLKATVSALAVKKQDLRDVLAKTIIKGDEPKNINSNSIAYEFGKTDVNFNDSTVLMRIHATAKIAPEINEEELKQGILGKKEEQVKEFLAGYPEVESFTVSYWPSFISGKIPMYGQRVEITLDNN
jgi:hypothetical protein